MNAVSINAYLCASFGARGHDVGPFRVSYDEGNTNRFVNYAVPRRAVAEVDIERLCAWFVAHERRPRLEYVPSECPTLEALLVEHGFTVEMRAPLLACSPDAVVVHGAPAGVTVRFALSDDDVRGALEAQHEAFGEPRPAASADVAEMQARAEVPVAIAVDEATGAVVGAAACPPPFEGVSEIVGVGVLPSHRGRGIASALVSFLVTEGPRFGITAPWISAAEESVARIYRRAGFKLVDEVLHISRP